MSLAPGTRLGTYEIGALIGRGGMGEVYRARDTRLGRDVALKVLPDTFAQDADRRARLQREAQLLAALNHPNIAQIYGLEEAAGGGALVMELVEGPTLADRIAQGPLPTDEALIIARQIADALEAAHERGIVHRDFKPANVKVRADGTVKVLDFGLAKTLEPAWLPADAQTTTPAAVTQQGAILGTVPYMSPEQARGQLADRRADIWAFGCVLYEMLAGRRAFAGDHVGDIVAAILRGEPDWRALPSALSPDVRRVLRRCLQRDRALRLRDIADVRLELSDPDASDVAVSQVRDADVNRARLRERLIWLAAVIVVGAVAGITWWSMRPAPLIETRFEITTPPTSYSSSFAISPDGRRLVFAATSGNRSVLWLRELNGTSVRPLAGTDEAQNPFWSPDGTAIAFSGNASLRRLDLIDGTVRTLAQSDVTSGAWNSSNDILYTPTVSSGLMRIPASGGEPRPVTPLGAGMTRHHLPQFLPDGRRFVFTCQGSEDVAGVYLGSLDSSEIRRLTDAGSSSGVLPSDRLLLNRQGALVARRIDLSRGSLANDVVPVADGVADVSVSSGGLFAYRSFGRALSQLIWFDRGGRRLGAIGDADRTISSPYLSPDGQRAAVERSGDIWVIDALRTTRLTSGPVREGYPVWSPDGLRVAFFSPRHAGRTSEYVKSSVDPLAPEELLVEIDAPRIFNGLTDWSHDGRFLLMDVNDPKPSARFFQDVWVLLMDEGRKVRPLLDSGFTERLARFSPNGQWVAYQSNESGRAEIYIRSFPGRGQQWPVSTGGGAQPRWRRDGKELYFIAPDAKLMAASVSVQQGTVHVGAPVALFQTRILYGGTEQPFRGQYDVAPDARFLINTVLDDSTPPIVIVQNWKAK